MGRRSSDGLRSARGDKCACVVVCHVMVRAEDVVVHPLLSTMHEIGRWLIQKVGIIIGDCEWSFECGLGFFFPQVFFLRACAMVSRILRFPSHGGEW